MKCTRFLLLCVVVFFTACASAQVAETNAEDEFEFGYKAARRGYWREAAMRFARADMLTPDNIRVLNNLAVSLEAVGQYDEAHAAYEKALSLSPNSGTALENYGRFEEFLGRLEKGTLPGKEKPKKVKGREVYLGLRIPPELDLEGTERVFIAPALAEIRGNNILPGTALAVGQEFERYLVRTLRKRTKLTLLSLNKPVALPCDNVEKLLEDKEFWTELADKTGTEYIVFAAIDVQVLDSQSFSPVEEYVSPSDGKTYFRRSAAGETGLKVDVLLTILGDDGEVHLSRRVTDFVRRPERKLNEFRDMFIPSYRPGEVASFLEEDIVNIFVMRWEAAKRFLYPRM